MVQTTIVIIILIVIAALGVVKFRKTFSKKNQSSSRCADCSAECPLVQHDNLKKTAQHRDIGLYCTGKNKVGGLSV